MKLVKLTEDRAEALLGGELEGPCADAYADGGTDMDGPRTMRAVACASFLGGLFYFAGLFGAA